MKKYTEKHLKPNSIFLIITFLLIGFFCNKYILSNDEKWRTVGWNIIDLSEKIILGPQRQNSEKLIIIISVEFTVKNILIISNNNHPATITKNILWHQAFL